MKDCLHSWVKGSEREGRSVFLNTLIISFVRVGTLENLDDYMNLLTFRFNHCKTREAIEREIFEHAENNHIFEDYFCMMEFARGCFIRKFRHEILRDLLNFKEFKLENIGGLATFLSSTKGIKHGGKKIQLDAIEKFDSLIVSEEDAITIASACTDRTISLTFLSNWINSSNTKDLNFFLKALSFIRSSAKEESLALEELILENVKEIATQDNVG